MSDRFKAQPQCFTCRHLDMANLSTPWKPWRCAAFDQIPNEIWNNDVDHAEPVDGDRGIQYERAPNADAMMGRLHRFRRV